MREAIFDMSYMDNVTDVQIRKAEINQCAKEIMRLVESELATMDMSKIVEIRAYIERPLGRGSFTQRKIMLSMRNREAEA